MKKTLQNAVFRVAAYHRNVRRLGIKVSMYSRISIAVASLSLAVLTGAQAARAPSIVTLRHSGKTLTMRKGSQVELRLTERYRWVGPRVRGKAVRLTPIEFFVDPGYKAWTVAARRRGTAVVTAVGYRTACDPGPCAPRRFRVTFVVR